MGSSDEVRRLLDERGIEWGSKTDCDTYWYGQDRTFYKFTEYRDGATSFTTCQWNLTPKQVLTTPIAATVGNRTDLSKRLREVNGLHEFAELFGFSWADESDWTWHDVARAMADEIDAVTEKRSCSSCPEMSNPDSYISLLQSALKWHNGYMSMPTNPRNTCVVLKGQKPSEEVLFVHDEGGVTHYLPEAT